jgi:hypothetical protein
MDAYSPDFSAYWNAAPAQDALGDDERRSAGEDQALAELADRIQAARSIV